MHDWQTDKKPSSHSATDVFVTEAVAWAFFNSIASFLNPETLVPLKHEIVHMGSGQGG